MAVADKRIAGVQKKRRLRGLKAPVWDSPDEWKVFAYDGLSGTCLWCGETLKKHYRYDARNALAGGEGVGGGLGPYEDGMFCRMRCGYQFGARLGALGDRLG